MLCVCFIRRLSCWSYPPSLPFHPPSHLSSGLTVWFRFWYELSLIFPLVFVCLIVFFLCENLSDFHLIVRTVFNSSAVVAPSHLRRLVLLTILSLDYSFHSSLSWLPHSFFCHHFHCHFPFFFPITCLLPFGILSRGFSLLELLLLCVCGFDVVRLTDIVCCVHLENKTCTIVFYYCELPHSQEHV